MCLHCRLQTTLLQYNAVIITLIFPAAVAPVCSPGQSAVYGSARQELVSVTCDVVGNPDTDLHFDWSFSKGDERLDMQQSQIR